MVFGFMSLGGIPYLSTLPLGNAQPGGECVYVQGGSCRGYNTSHDQSGPNPWCCNSSSLICTGNVFGSDTDAPFDPTYNASGTCNPCTHIQGNSCATGKGHPCCAGYYCDLNDECQPCVAPGANCYSTANTAGSCCPWHQDGNNDVIQYACIESYCTPCSGQNAACSSSTPCCNGLTCDPSSSTCQYCSLSGYDTTEYSCDIVAAFVNNKYPRECCGNLTCYPVEDTYTIYACLPCVGDHEVCDPSIDVCCSDELNCASNIGTSDYYCRNCSLLNDTCSRSGKICCNQASCYPTDSQDTWRCTQCTSEYDGCNTDIQPCCGTMECFLYSSTQPPHCMNCTEGLEKCDDTVPSCCEGFDCLSGICQPCTDMGEACNPQFTTSCCDNGTCSYNSTIDNYTCQNCIPEYESCDVDDDGPLCCSNLTCYSISTDNTNTTCQDCLDINAACTGQKPDCCGVLYCTNSTSTSANLTCAECIQTGIDCTTGQICCSRQSCGADGTCPASPNGALSLFSTNISLKQLVGFAVVMMAAGIL